MYIVCKFINNEIKFLDIEKIVENELEKAGAEYVLDTPLQLAEAVLSGK